MSAHRPPGWISVPLGALGQWGSGGTPSKARSEFYAAGTIPWLVIGDLNDGVVVAASTNITKAGLVGSSAKLVQAGTIFVAMYGSIGKMGVAGIPCATNQAIAHFVPDFRLINPRYAFLAIRAVRPDLLKLGQGGAQQNIGQGILKNFEIPLAPLTEQARIADKLDKLLARIDACRGSLKTVKSLTQRLRQSMLLAFKSGRLGTTGSETWREVALGDVAEVGTGSTPLKSNQRFYTAEGTPWVTSAATGAPFVTGASEFVTAEAIAASRLKLYAPGTLLVAMYGEGKTRGQVTELAIEATINQACAAVVVDVNQARRDFVKLVLQAQYIELREMAEGGNQPNLNLSKVRSMRFSLPALAVQDEILRIAARLLSVTSTVEARVAQVSATLDSLTRAVLAKAFRGELVPQDPADEPAERMLERLRTTEAPKAAARRRRSAGRGIDQTASA